MCHSPCTPYFSFRGSLSYFSIFTLPVPEDPNLNHNSAVMGLEEATNLQQSIFAEPLGGAPQPRWQAPGQEPPAQHPTPRGDDIIVPKLGSGPQKHKYTVEQMLSLFAVLTERGGLGRPLILAGYGEELHSDETRHRLLFTLEGIAQQMVRDFAEKILFGGRFR
jgi:hypothetical protein